MDRGKPLQRKTPLANGKPMARGGSLRRTPMKRTVQSGQAKAATARRRATKRATAEHGGPWQQVREIVHARAGGRCELCGTPITLDQMEAHHRRTRTVGPDCPCNALALCSGCHHGPRVHKGPTRAMELGTIVSRHLGADPGTIPVTLRIGEVFLDCDGSWGWTASAALC